MCSVNRSRDDVDVSPSAYKGWPFPVFNRVAAILFLTPSCNALLTRRANSHVHARDSHRMCLCTVLMMRDYLFVCAALLTHFDPFPLFCDKF